jgi:hypothetical protein
MKELNNACGIYKLMISMVLAVVFGFLAYVFKDKYDKQSSTDNSKTNYYLMIIFGVIGGGSFMYLTIGGTISQFSKECRVARYKYEKGDI